MAVFKQANACCSPFTKCQLIPSLGKLLCYENNLKSKDLVLCVAKKSTKQEQIGGNWSATLFPSYPYTVYSSSALEIPLVKELH